MRFSRRELFVALLASVVGAQQVGGSPRERSMPVDTLLAVAETVSPSDLDVDGSLIEDTVLNRPHIQPQFDEQVSAAAAALDDEARRKYQTRFAALERPKRQEVLRDAGVHLTPPDPRGTVAQRIRYYLVNEVLYVLYTSPIGGRAVGVENPPGYPGGREAYQRGPDREA